MRYFHLNKNKYHNPIVNLDKLWSLVGEEVRCGGCLCLVCVWGGGRRARLSLMLSEAA